jgi:hypothetical protein
MFRTTHTVGLAILNLATRAEMRRGLRGYAPTRGYVPTRYVPINHLLPPEVEARRFSFAPDERQDLLVCWYKPIQSKPRLLPVLGSTHFRLKQRSFGRFHDDAASKASIANLLSRAGALVPSPAMSYVSAGIRRVTNER